MKSLTTILRSALSAFVLGLATLATAPRALAQETVARVNIPFDFQYGSTHLKAGHYLVSMKSDQIMAVQGKRSAMELVRWETTSNNTPTQTGKLVFRRYGDQYVLKQVWIAGEDEHIQCPKSNSERRLQEELAQNSTPATDVEIALLDSPR